MQKYFSNTVTVSSRVLSSESHDVIMLVPKVSLHFTCVILGQSSKKEMYDDCCISLGLFSWWRKGHQEEFISPQPARS